MSRAGKSYKFIYEIILKTRRFGLLSAYSCPDAAGVACSLLAFKTKISDNLKIPLCIFISGSLFKRGIFYYILKDYLQPA